MIMGKPGEAGERLSVQATVDCWQESGHLSQTDLVLSAGSAIYQTDGFASHSFLLPKDRDDNTCFKVLY